MASINGVKKSSVKKKQHIETDSGATAKIILAVGITALCTLLIVFGIWKLFLEEKVAIIYTQQATSENTMVYRAVADMELGAPVDGLVELVPAPKTLVSSITLTNGADLSSLKASKVIRANEIITSENTYNPVTQDIVLSTSRQVSVDYLKTPGVQVGDYIDIRFKVYKGDNASTYRDETVCTKKEVLGKTEDTIVLMLSESEILNLNNAVVEAAVNSKETSAELYTTKYVDIVNQPKASVTYSGKGIAYTEQELTEAQQRLKNIQQGNPDYTASDVVVYEEDLGEEGEVIE